MIKHCSINQDTIHTCKSNNKVDSVTY